MDAVPANPLDGLSALDLAGADVRGIKARLRFSDGRSYDQAGSIDFVDVSVDRATDTVLARAVFANPASALFDGQLVRVDLEGGTPQEKVLIPQAALTIAASSLRPMTDRVHAQADQVVGCQLQQHFAIDIVVAECGRVLFEPQLA